MTFSEQETGRLSLLEFIGSSCTTKNCVTHNVTQLSNTGLSEVYARSEGGGETVTSARSSGLNLNLETLEKH